MQRIPKAAPTDLHLSQKEWEYLLKRDKEQCALKPVCALRGIVGYCDDSVDVDHRQPQALGGDDSLANLRLLCAHPNRGRACEPDAQWAKPNYWDEPNINISKLRHVQAEAGWEAVDTFAAGLKPDDLIRLRKTLLGSTTLLVGATGIGKTVLFQSLAFRINHLIGVGYPRIRRVLWLTTDNTLRDMAYTELETETYSLGIAPNAPKVVKAPTFADFKSDPGADITVATVHMLWKVESKDGVLRREDNAIRDALLGYDTIVFDEGDWATEEMRHIAHLARHAWQFALTATPRIAVIVGGEKAKDTAKRFVLITPDAIASYKTAVHTDMCVKVLGEARRSVGHDGRAELERGIQKLNKEQVSNDLVLWCSLVVEAVLEADHFETNMKMLSPDLYYSPHIMVRFQDIKDIKLATYVVQERLNELKGKALQNPGWNIAPLFAGMRAGEFTHLSEHGFRYGDLSAKNGKLWTHPFMMAKNTNGQAAEASCRILFMCNIGTRGINNWPVQTIVDNSNKTSLTDLIQFIQGRPIRWPPHLAEWLMPGHPMRKFATTKVMIPPSEIEEDKLKAIEVARRFIETMHEEIKSAGLLTWNDLLEGQRIEDAQPNIAGVTHTVTQADKYLAQGLVSEVLEENGSLLMASSEDIVKRLVDDSMMSVPSDKIEKLVRYVERLLSDPDFCVNELTAKKTYTAVNLKPECVIDKLLPQQEYSLDVLLRWVHSDPLYHHTWKVCEQRLQDNDQLTIDQVSNQLRTVQQLNYRSLPRLYQLNQSKKSLKPGVFELIASDLYDELRQGGQWISDRSVVPIAVRAAAKTLFDIDKADNGGDMDHPAYHFAMLGKHREKIKAMARAKMVKDNLWPRILKLAEYQQQLASQEEEQPAA